MSRSDDRDEIRELLARYGLLWDTGQTDNFAELFCEDGDMFLRGTKPVSGRDALKRFAAKFPPNEMHHFMTNAVIDVEGDSAAVQSSFLVMKGQPPTASSSGRYRDQLVKKDGSWYIQHREMILDQPLRLASPVAD